MNAARLYMEAMDMWRQHITKDCQFHGIVVKGGEAPNIVPEEVCLDYYYRAATLENLWKLNKISETVREVRHWQPVQKWSGSRDIRIMEKFIGMNIWIRL